MEMDGETGSEEGGGGSESAAEKYGSTLSDDDKKIFAMNPIVNTMAVSIARNIYNGVVTLADIDCAIRCAQDLVRMKLRKDSKEEGVYGGPSGILIP